MTLRFKIFGIEVASLALEAQAGETPVQVIERESSRVLEKVMANRTVGKVIGRVSTAWVATGMKR